MDNARKKIAVFLEKHGKKTRQRAWLDIARRISKPRRGLAKVNVWKLGILAKKQKGKTFVVLGHVLGTGDAPAGIKVAALSFSRSARQKISNAKGQALGLKELASLGEKTSAMVIVR